jgi:two-component system, chemotaxis family, sensor kinase CheA
MSEDGVDLKEFLSGFLVEAEEHLSTANNNLLEAETILRRGQAPARQVRELFRALHTIKGLAAMVGVEPIVDLAHELESVLRRADRAGGRLEPSAVEVLLEGIRAIEHRVGALEKGEAAEPAPRSLLERIAELAPGSQAPSAAAAALHLAPELDAKLDPSEREQLAQGAREGFRPLQVEFYPSPTRAAAGLTITTVRERLEGPGQIVKVLPRSVPQGPRAPGGLAFTLLLLTHQPDDEVLAAAGGAPSTVQELQLGLELSAASAQDEGALPWMEEAGESAPQRRSLVRVDVHRLDDALEKLSALVVTRHRLSRVVGELSATGVDVRELAGVVGEAARQLRDLRTSIMNARMVPVADLLERVPLVVRGLTRTTGKPLSLELDTGHAEVDKAVGERVFPAIIHLIRNAVDHGIEEPAERARLGKPAEGHLRVASHPLGSHALELVVSDDGRGIDAEAVAQRAGAPLPRAPGELLALLCRPGLSTRAQVDQTSGRGMGMDIVRRTIEQLGGQVALATAPGRGSTFTLRIPLSITIVDAFTFGTGTQLFAVPVATIEEIVEVDPTALVEAPAPDKATRAPGRLLNRRGMAVPLMSLGQVLSLGPDDQEVKKALLVRRDGEVYAFGVQRMVGQQEVVVRPAEDPLVKVAGVSGSTDLGDGRPTLVVDLLALSAHLGGAHGEAP